MAKFEAELPKELMADFEKVFVNSEKIFGQMTKAGAKVVMSNIKAAVPSGIRSSDMMNCLRITKTYKTPTDDGINTKVGFYGYFINKNGVRTPAPLVANVFEYGRSNAPFPKQPFLRRSFNEGQIKAAMLKEQEKASGGILK